MITPVLSKGLRRFGWLAGGALLGAAWVPVSGFAQIESPEPTHNGKPVSAWVAALEPGRSVSSQPRQADAEEALHALGPKAIPFILRYKGGDRNQRLDLIRHACAILEPEGSPELVDGLNDRDPLVRETALEVISKAALPGALDDIVKLLTDPVRPVRIAAVLSMVRLAPDRDETVAGLMEFLHEIPPAKEAGNAEFSKADAALALAKLGAKAKGAIPELSGLLADSDEQAREAAAVALWKIERNPQVVPVLADRLENARDYQTCVRVLKILGEMGPLARAAAPVVRKRVEDPGLAFVPSTLDLSRLAAEVLAKIDPASGPAASKSSPDLSGEDRR